MNTMKWLLRREFWEHKGGFVWAPLIAAVIMVVLVAGVVGYGVSSGRMNGDSITVRVGGEEVHRSQMADLATRHSRTEMASVAANNYIAVGAPVFIVLPTVAFFYFLAALYDDRRDRSILFWKSLPISDSTTVLSKLLTGLVLAPVITVGIASAAAFLILMLAGVAVSAQGVNLFGPVLSNVNLYLSPLYLLAMIPVYVLWALPTAGWLLLVSSWAKSKVFLWAVGLPLIVAVLLKWMDYLLALYGSTIHADWIVNNVLETLLLGLVPGAWFMDGGTAMPVNGGHGVNLLSVLGASWGSLARPELWVGAAAGVAMILGAVRLRRWRDEG
jgi:ABC-2 type transport system permease protein